MQKRTLRFGSLFSGVGGLDLAIERCGFQCRWQVEIDPFCRSILARHWPAAARYNDVRKLKGDDLEPVDLIAGGYPCQPFSQAGKRHGARDPRHLWPEFARLLGELQPRYAFLENVPGHLTLGFRDVLADLARLGYDAEWTTLSAAETGAPHIRQRLFVLAYRDGGGRGERGIEKRPPRHAERARYGMENASRPRRSPAGTASPGPAETADFERSGHAILADAGRGFFPLPRGNKEARTGTRQTGAALADTDPLRSERTLSAGWQPGIESEDIREPLSNAQCPRLQGPQRDGEGFEPTQQFLSPYPPPANDLEAWGEILALDPWCAPALEAPPQSLFRRMANELPAPLVAALHPRRARLRALGNAVSPPQGELAFRELWQRMKESEEPTR